MCLAIQGGQETANISWSAFHANTEQINSGETQEETQTTTSCLLPLFQEDAATISMMRHSLDVIRKVVQLTNPRQVPVVAMDQPLFALAKSIQWKGSSYVVASLLSGCWNMDIPVPLKELFAVVELVW